MIVLPAHNEARALSRVLDEIQAETSLEIIVVDDASVDATREVARQKGVKLLPLPFQLGAWGATQTGLRYARSKGVDYVVTMDSDGQHEAQYLREICAPIANPGTDVVIGSFVARGSTMRKIAWVILRRVCGLKISDITSGFRVYNKQAIEVLASRESTLLQFQDVGVLIRLQTMDLRVTEVPISMRARADGPSRVFYSWGAVLYYMLYSVILGFSKRQR